MEFNFVVRRNSTYMELIITAENVNASSGLLDEKESINLATDLIDAAEELLPAKTGEIEYRLREAREELEEKLNRGELP